MTPVVNCITHLYSPDWKIYLQLSWILNLCDVYEGKVSLKRWVFSNFLNVSTDLTLLMWYGSEFHRVGAATLDEQSVKVLCLVLGRLSCKLSALVVDLRPCLRTGL